MLVPDAQRTRAADRGKAHAHQSEAVSVVRRRFDTVDARDWLAPSGIERVLASIGFVDGLKDVPLVDLGRKTPSGDISLIVACDHRTSLSQPVAAVADDAVARLLDGFDRMARRYGLAPFPSQGLGD